MNDKTEQTMTDALIDQIESAARASFRRHQSSIKGQILTAADNYDWHLLHAAYQAGNQTMRAQLAEVRKDAELERALQQAAKDLPAHFVISVNVERDAGWVELYDRYGYITKIDQEDLTLAEQVRAAIDAAKGGRNA